MIRTITNRDATRGTHKAHGKPMYGLWFGLYNDQPEGTPVEFRSGGGSMIDVFDRRTGQRIARIGYASKFYFAPIPLPAIGDELIYTAEGDGQEYQVRAIGIQDGSDALVRVELISDGQALWVDASRLRYNLDALHAQALKEDRLRGMDRVIMDELHELALKEDAERFPTPAPRTIDTRVCDLAEDGSIDLATAKFDVVRDTVKSLETIADEMAGILHSSAHVQIIVTDTVNRDEAVRFIVPGHCPAHGEAFVPDYYGARVFAGSVVRWRDETHVVTAVGVQDAATGLSVYTWVQFPGGRKVWSRNTHLVDMDALHAQALAEDAERSGTKVDDVMMLIDQYAISRAPILRDKIQQTMANLVIAAINQAPSVPVTRAATLDIMALVREYGRQCYAAGRAPDAPSDTSEALARVQAALDSLTA